MTTKGEATIVVVSVTLSLSCVLACVAISPNLGNSEACAPQVSQVVAPLTSQNPVLMSKGQSLGGTDESMEFSVDRPAEFRGSWVSTSPAVVGISGMSLFCGGATPLGGPLPIGALNGTINETLFPGDHILYLEWMGNSANSTWTVTESFVVSFDRGLDLLAGPGSIPLAPQSYAAWTIVAPTHAFGFLLQWAVTTNSCNDELAVLSATTFQAFRLGVEPLNGNGTAVLGGSSTSPCGSSGPATETAVFGPFNWSSGDVLVYFNGGERSATLTLLAPLDAVYLT